MGLQSIQFIEPLRHTVLATRVLARCKYIRQAIKTLKLLSLNYFNSRRTGMRFCISYSGSSKACCQRQLLDCDSLIKASFRNSRSLF